MEGAHGRFPPSSRSGAAAHADTRPATRPAHTDTTRAPHADVGAGTAGSEASAGGAARGTGPYLLTHGCARGGSPASQRMRHRGGLQPRKHSGSPTSPEGMEGDDRFQQRSPHGDTPPPHRGTTPRHHTSRHKRGAAPTAAQGRRSMNRRIGSVASLPMTHCAR